MKKVTLTLEEYLFQFYQKIGQLSGKSTEQVNRKSEAASIRKLPFSYAAVRISFA